MVYRVVQWATGAMGRTALRAVLDHPDLELAGLYVYNPAKDGLDAGEIARRPPTGVRATRRIEDIEACSADVVLHMPQLQMPYESHLDDIVRLLASGKDVITITAHHHPLIDTAGLVGRLQEACRLGGSTFFGTGINPGFIVERLAVTATGMCTRVDRVSVREVFDASAIADPAYVQNVLGLGASPSSVDLVHGPLARLFHSQFVGSVGYVGAALGLELDEIVSDNSVVVAPEDITVASGTIDRGTVAATSWRLHGTSGGQPVVTLDVNWTLAPGLTGHRGDSHWTLRIEGRPGIDIRVDLLDPQEPGIRTRAAQYATVAPALRAIPAVHDAPPGLFELPTLLPWVPRLAGAGP